MVQKVIDSINKYADDPEANAGPFEISEQLLPIFVVNQVIFIFVRQGALIFVAQIGIKGDKIVQIINTGRLLNLE
jgi:hypothetical protein